VLLYGANGYTGRLIVAEAVRRGLAPILAGRDRAAIEKLARHHGLPCRVVGLGDPQALAEAVRGSGAVLHAAGPFVRTALPMVEACLAERVPYLDITGEIEVFERVFRLDARARAAGVALLPGAGFDVVPSDGLALTLKERLPAATHLDLAFVSEGGTWSRGTLATRLESIDRGGAERRDGRLVPVPPAADGFLLALPTGRRYVVQIPWGDIATAWRTTGIGNLRTFAGMPPRTARRLRRARPLFALAGWTPVRRLLQALVRATVSGPDERMRREARMELWGRAWDAASGRSVEAGLATPEGYAFTAIAAVECARRIEAGDLAPGAWTPAAAFGSRFAASLPGVLEREFPVSALAGAGGLSAA
jgi:saccharopine dehydrogenase (NAD+, L-lysine-forming)